MASAREQVLFLRVVAGAGMVPTPADDERRLLVLADLRRLPAPGVEAAAGRRLHRARDVADQPDPARAARPAGSGRARPRAAPACRGARARRRCSSLAPTSTIRPRYITATRSDDVPHDGQVVGDEDDRSSPNSTLQLAPAGSPPAPGWRRRARTPARRRGAPPGCSARARAMPIRCRWPPENWCG